MPDDDHEHHLHGFAVPIDLERITKQRDRAEMESDRRTSRMHRFLEGLDVDQCLALRDILNQDAKSPMMNYFDGQVVALLRWIHHVDPDTGETENAILDRPQP